MTAPAPTKRPAFLFYPGDWLRSTPLQSCSIAARGVWIQLICWMHEGTPYGHLRMGSEDLSPADLARMLGLSRAETTRLLAELEKRRVFSRTESGTIYSPRMVRDEQLRQARAAGGKKSQENPNVPRRKGPPEGHHQGSGNGRVEGYPSSDPSPGSSPPSPAVAVLQEHLQDAFAGPSVGRSVEPPASRSPHTRRGPRDSG
jgi:AraC-like DNA-binding protein